MHAGKEGCKKGGMQWMQHLVQVQLAVYKKDQSLCLNWTDLVLNNILNTFQVRGSLLFTLMHHDVSKALNYLTFSLFITLCS